MDFNASHPTTHPDRVNAVAMDNVREHMEPAFLSGPVMSRMPETIRRSPERGALCPADGMDGVASWICPGL